ncbi:hypothetical protein ACFQL7_27580 [Halocatena marina]|uniref:Major tail protein n=1 Tax=Halocatena marina TaxID=2934937 RepID=A0ABD5YVC2_9EURY
MPEIKPIDINNNKTFENATTGLSDDWGAGLWEGPAQLGRTRKRTDLANNTAYAGSSAYLLGLGCSAFAEVGTVFEVNGPSNQAQEADITIRGDYLMESASGGTGSAKFRLSVFLLDLTESQGVVDVLEPDPKAKEMSEVIVREATTAALYWKSVWPENDPENDSNRPYFEETIAASKNDKLKTGGIYYVGILAETKAVADGPGFCWADIWTGTDQHNAIGETDCFANFSEILVEWEGKVINV